MYLVYQEDTRPLNMELYKTSQDYDPKLFNSDYRPSYQMSKNIPYYAVTSLINKAKANKIGIDYEWFNVTKEDYGEKHPSWAKFAIVNKLLNDEKYAKYKIFIYLDTDAWIRDEQTFMDLINYLDNNENFNFIFSRDPAWPGNTYINAGCIFIKNNDYSRNFYKNIAEDIPKFSEFYNKAFTDQSMLSVYIVRNLKKSLILKDHILNTPIGSVVRHDWWKNDFMYASMFDELLALKRCELYGEQKRDPNSFKITDYIDPDYASKCSIVLNP